MDVMAGVAALVFIGSAAWFIVSLVRLPFNRQAALRNMKRSALTVAATFVAVVAFAFASPSIEERSAANEAQRIEREARDAKREAERQQREAERREVAAQKARDEIARKCSDVVAMFHRSRDFVRDRLKAPSTASFPWASEARVQHVSGCRYLIVSHVDAQNSFGAMIRSAWVVDIEYRPDSNDYLVHSVAID